MEGGKESKSKVWDGVLGPMCDMYPPPHHLRQDARARERALRQYEKVLAPFSGETLTRAWDAVCAENTFWVWPAPGVLVAACQRVASRHPAFDPEQQRKQQAREMADDYLRHYRRTSKVYAVARRDGWAGRLLDYVAAAAWVEGQLICGCEGISWDAILLTGYEPGRSSAEALGAYRETIRGAVEQGKIRVTVPPTRIAQWKAEGKAEQRPDEQSPSGNPGKSRGRG